MTVCSTDPRAAAVAGGEVARVPVAAVPRKSALQPRLGRARLVMRSPVSTPLVLALGLACALAGCGTNRLDISDSNAPSTSVGAVYRFTPSGAGGLQAQYESYRADSVQHLGDIDTASLDGRTIFGPADIENRSRVRLALLGYNHHMFAGRKVQMQWFAGLSGLRMDWTAMPRDATQPTLSRHVEWLGPWGGATGLWPLTPVLTLEARVAAGQRAVFDDNGQWSQVELGFGITPWPALKLRLGLSERRVKAVLASPESVLRVRARGPYLGLSFELQ